MSSWKVPMAEGYKSTSSHKGSSSSSQQFPLASTARKFLKLCLKKIRNAMMHRSTASVGCDESSRKKMTSSAARAPVVPMASPLDHWRESLENFENEMRQRMLSDPSNPVATFTYCGGPAEDDAMTYQFMISPTTGQLCATFWTHKTSDIQPAVYAPQV